MAEAWVSPRGPATCVMGLLLAAVVGCGIKALPRPPLAGRPGNGAEPDAGSCATCTDQPEANPPQDER